MVEGVDFYFPFIREAYNESKKLMLNEGPQNDTSFLETLKGQILKLNSDFAETDKSIENFLLGKESIENVITAIQRVNLEFRMAMAVRNKLIDAYQEIMRMQI